MADGPDEVTSRLILDQLKRVEGKVDEANSSIADVRVSVAGIEALDVPKLRDRVQALETAVAGILAGGKIHWQWITLAIAAGALIVSIAQHAIK